MDSARKDVGAQVWAYVLSENHSGLLSHSLTLTGAVPRLCRKEGARAGLGPSVWPYLDLWGPGLSATKTACAWDMYMISEQRPTMWDDLGSERL